MTSMNDANEEAEVLACLSAPLDPNKDKQFLSGYSLFRGTFACLRSSLALLIFFLSKRRCVRHLASSRRLESQGWQDSGPIIRTCRLQSHIARLQTAAPSRPSTTYSWRENQQILADSRGPRTTSPTIDRGPREPLSIPRRTLALLRNQVP